MLLPLSTLKQIEYYEVTQTDVGGYTHLVDDVIVLHFKQWWKGDKTIIARRKTVEIDEDECTFRHVRSHDAEELLGQLSMYMESTYEEEAPKKRVLAKVLSIVDRIKK